MIKYAIILAFFSIPFSLSAQTLGATDKSEKSVNRYKSVIQNNKDVVDFIEYSLVERGLPRHLKNLAFIESSFDSGTVSSAGASGIWQFMTAHASEYGLTERDRNDIYKSTKAAMSSLKNLYNKYGNWVTVVAAYNCGEGNIQKAMDRAGSKRYTDFYQYLPAETINHVQKYLNASYASGHLDDVLNDYNGLKANTSEVVYQKFVPKEIDTSISTTQINSAYNLDVIAKFLKIKPNDLLIWNKNLNKELSDTGEGILSLPNELMTVFSLNQDEILSQSLKVMN